MVLFVIPTSTELSHYEQQTELDGVLYGLTFQWNERESAWYLDLATAAGEMIVAGVKLVPNWPLLRKVVDERRPPGELVVLDVTGAGVALGNLGTDTALVYLDAAALAEIADG